MKKAEIHLILDNIRSAHNVGSIFRTAETVRVAKIYCAGTTPAPRDRFGTKRKDLAKVALGAEELVPWEHVPSTIRLVRKLKKEGFRIVAIEQSPYSVDYRKVKVGRKAVLILGNEVGGVDPKVLKSSDVIAEIPLEGKKESLNVSVAAGVVLFGMLC